MYGLHNGHVQITQQT